MADIKYYTLAEVATHKTNNDVWMVIHNNVYNVTEFLNEVSLSCTTNQWPTACRLPHPALALPSH